MGYYSNWSGNIATHQLSEADVKELFNCFKWELSESESFEDDTLGFVNAMFEKNESGTVIYFDITGDGNYYENNVYNFLKKIAPYTDHGEIEFSGESNDFWRFDFRHGKWYEDEGERIMKYNLSTSPLRIIGE